MRLNMLLPLVMVAALLGFACSTGIAAVTEPETPTPVSGVVSVSSSPEPTPSDEGRAEPTSLEVEETSGDSQAQDVREILVVDISMYLLVNDSNDPDFSISSNRSEDDLRKILDGMNEIWSQADIRLEPQFVGTLEVPEDVLTSVATGDLRTFFVESRRGFSVPEPSTINAFFAREIGGPNGINPFGSQSFFVMDEPSVHDRRVSSHEVGHILGLHHVLTDSGRLLFSGTNGMELTEEEVTVARYVLKGILDNLR